MENTQKPKSSFGKLFRTCLLSLFIGGVCVTGILVGYGISDFYKQYNPTQDFSSEKVYIKNNFDWVYEELTEEQKKEILEESEKHFIYKFDVENQAEYKKFFQTYDEFIMINLENQRSRLVDVFDYPYLPVITVNLIDTEEKYLNKSKLDWEGELEFSGFADYQHNIFLYIPQDKLNNKDNIADLITHELVHSFQFDVTNWSTNFPNWYTEGMAEHYSTSGDPFDIYNVKEKYPNLSSLEDSFKKGNIENIRLTYYIAHSFYNYLTKNHEKELMVIMRETRFQNFNQKFTSKIGRAPETMYLEWIETF